MSNINDIKIRCFDAETARDEAINARNYMNGVLTQVADQLGVMQMDGDKRVYDPADITARITELLETEELHNTPTNDYKETK